MLAAAALAAAGPASVGLAADHAEDATHAKHKKQAEGEPTAAPSDEHDPAKRLPATEYLTMDPFVVPVVNNGRHEKQFVLVVAVELGEDGDRAELRRLSPKMRDEIYDMLFKVVSFRTMKPRIPPTAMLRTRLASIVRRVAGEKSAKSIVIKRADVTNIR